ncbi:Uncharacterised protein [Mycobacteroides abscessus subsp. abscessus]|nr:Uncharacterised protein [Mycobacteroides abscessus subsp. abscessus]
MRGEVWWGAAEDAVQLRVGDAEHRPGDEVGEHRARVDRRQLVRVADEYQPGVRP